MKKKTERRIVCLNRNGDVIDPSKYLVTRVEAPWLYKYLEELNHEQKQNPRRSA